jgi:Uma2 family endonuclease
MGLPLKNDRLDAQAYLDWEAQQPGRSEYIDGEVFAMVGVRRVHATVALNIGAALREHLRGTPCLAFTADMKLRVETVDAFFYPDVMVTCNAQDRRAELFIEHPLLIVEVLSDSTAAYDRGAKFAGYRQVPELQEYVLIDIAARRVEVFRRQPGNEWLLHDYADEPDCRFDSVKLTLSLATVFEDVDTAEDQAPAAPADPQ